MSNYIHKYLLLFIILAMPFMSIPLKAMDEESDKLSILIKRTVGPLCFSSCSITDDKACKIAKILKDCQDITSVNFNHNKIGNIGIKSLSESFSSMSCLNQIHLYGNPIEDEGFRVFFPALKNLKSLSFLDLRETKMDITGYYMLAELLKENLNLKIHLPTINSHVLDEMLMKNNIN